MKLIAFKRAGTSFPSLHPESIVEYIDTQFLTSTEGYETLLEEDFKVELAKNEERLASHLKKLEEEAKATLLAQEQAEIARKAEEKELEREFEIFKRWKQNKKK